MRNTTKIILAELEPREYDCGNHKIQLLSPAIVAFQKDSFRTHQQVELGLGLVADHSTVTHFWNSCKSNNLAQICRALKMLGHCNVIHDDTFCACYYVANPEMSSTVRHYLLSLEDSGVKSPLSLRQKIISSKVDRNLIAKIAKSANKYRLDHLATQLIVA